MQISDGDLAAPCARSPRRPACVLRSRASAAACAYGPPLPIAAMPSSGSITSPVPRQHEQMFGVADDQQRLQPPQRAVLAPVLGQLDGGAPQVLVLAELRLELLEQRDAVGGRAGEAGHHLAARDFADLARAVLDDRLVERHLTVAGNRELAVAPHRQNRRGSNATLVPVSTRERSRQTRQWPRARARPSSRRAFLPTRRRGHRACRPSARVALVILSVARRAAEKDAHVTFAG